MEMITEFMELEMATVRPEEEDITLAKERDIKRKELVNMMTTLMTIQMTTQMTMKNLTRNQHTKNPLTKNLCTKNPTETFNLTNELIN